MRLFLLVMTVFVCLCVLGHVCVWFRLLVFVFVFVLGCSCSKVFVCAACRRVCVCDYTCLLAVVCLCVWSMVCAACSSILCGFSLLVVACSCVCFSCLFVFV